MNNDISISGIPNSMMALTSREELMNALQKISLIRSVLVKCYIENYLESGSDLTFGEYIAERYNIPRPQIHKNLLG